MIFRALIFNKIYIAFSFLLFLSLFSCDQNSELEKTIKSLPIEVKVERFDQAFMKMKAEHLRYLKMPYPFLFPKHIPDSVFLNRTQDPIQKMIQSSVDSVFMDFETTEKDLISLYKHIKYYRPSLVKPRLISVYSDVDYRNRVIVTDSIVIIGIDNYLGADHPFYEGFYKYVKKNLKKDQIVMDLADTYAARWINEPKRNTFLAELIYQGKKLYLKDLWVPSAEDSTKIGYTKEELQWAQDNAFYIWQYFVENELLYSTDPKLLSRFIAPAPFSRFNLGLDSESPGGIGRYIGWKIVKSYVNNNDNSLIQLLQMDAQTIFNKSKYKP